MEWLKFIIKIELQIKPERAFDPTNLAVIRKDEHSEYHNSDYPQNEKGYEQFEKKYKK